MYRVPSQGSIVGGGGAGVSVGVDTVFIGVGTGVLRGVITGFSLSKPGSDCDIPDIVSLMVRGMRVGKMKMDVITMIARSIAMVMITIREVFMIHLSFLISYALF